MRNEVAELANSSSIIRFLATTSYPSQLFRNILHRITRESWRHLIAAFTCKAEKCKSCLNTYQQGLGWSVYWSVFPYGRIMPVIFPAISKLEIYGHRLLIATGSSWSQSLIASSPFIATSCDNNYKVSISRLQLEFGKLVCSIHKKTPVITCIKMSYQGMPCEGRCDRHCLPSDTKAFAALWSHSTRPWRRQFCLGGTRYESMWCLNCWACWVKVWIGNWSVTNWNREHLKPND